MKKILSRIPRTVLTVLFIAALALAGYFYYQYQQVRQKDSATEAKKLVKTLSHFMVLPEEQPTLATVTDKSKLSDQPFFQKAENGDKILIFVQSRKAILYRPSLHKIIDVAPINASSAP